MALVQGSCKMRARKRPVNERSECYLNSRLSTFLIKRNTGEFNYIRSLIVHRKRGIVGGVYTRDISPDKYLSS